MTKFQADLFQSKSLARKFKREQNPELTWLPITPGSVLFCLDPSISNCGWAIIRNTRPNPERIDSGCLHPIGSTERNRYDHLSELIKQRLELSARDGAEATDAIIEIPSGGQWRNTGALMTYTRAIGVCEATCLCLGLSVNRVAVQEWKGMGKKHETARVVKFCFNYESRDSNEADALGIGLWLCSKTRSRGL